MNKIKLSISAPLYNESKNCVAGIKDMLKQLNKEVKSFELILVNNGSTDDTADIIEKMKSKHKNIVTVHLKTNQGYGGGIIAGLKKSKGEYIAFCGFSNVIRRRGQKSIKSKTNGSVTNMGFAISPIRKKRKPEDKYLTFYYLHIVCKPPE